MFGNRGESATKRHLKREKIGNRICSHFAYKHRYLLSGQFTEMKSFQLLHKKHVYGNKPSFSQVSIYLETDFFFFQKNSNMRKVDEFVKIIHCRYSFCNINCLKFSLITIM